MCFGGYQAPFTSQHVTPVTSPCSHCYLVCNMTLCIHTTIRFLPHGMTRRHTHNTALSRAQFQPWLLYVWWKFNRHVLRLGRNPPVTRRQWTPSLATSEWAPTPSGTRRRDSRGSSPSCRYVNMRTYGVCVGDVVAILCCRGCSCSVRLTSWLLVFSCTSPCSRDRW